MPFCRRGSSWASMSGLTNRKELSAAKPQPKGRRDFTAETRSSQSSESILTKKLFTLRPPRLRGESSDNLRTPRKLSRIAMHRTQSLESNISEPFAYFAFFAVEYSLSSHAIHSETGAFASW